LRARRRDVVGVDSCPGEKFGTGSGSGYLPHREVREVQLPPHRGEQGVLLFAGPR
jgi:hypothetical protein